MIKAPFVVGARVNRTKVLFTTEHNIKRAGFQYGKSGKKKRFSAASGRAAGKLLQRRSPLVVNGLTTLRFSPFAARQGFRFATGRLRTEW